MITAFAGSKAADGFLKHVDWRWGFGAFAIIYPFVALPVYLMLKFNLRKAEKQGVVTHEPSGRTLVQSVLHWVVEFDRERIQRRISIMGKMLIHPPH